MGLTELAHARVHAGLPVMSPQDAGIGGPGPPRQRRGQRGLVGGPHRHHLPLHQLPWCPVHSILVIHLHAQVFLLHLARITAQLCCSCARLGWTLAPAAWALCPAPHALAPGCRRHNNAAVCHGRTRACSGMTSLKSQQHCKTGPGYQQHENEHL